MLSAIYYPFSRCIDVSALKQLLLVFDGVTFMDPITDDEWRAYLMEEMIEQEDRRFAEYQNIHRVLDELHDEKAIQVIPPTIVPTEKQILASASALSDLLDQSWCRVASKPESYGMPHRHYALDGSATWQIFKVKMPDLFIESLENNDGLRRHLVHRGGEHRSWTLTYEAGSAISLSLHLAAAYELCLAPVTDSVMHHQLLLHKSMREHYGQEHKGELPLTEQTISHMAQQTAFTLVQQLLPRDMLTQVSFSEVLKFRREMAPYRDHLIRDLKARFGLHKSEVQPEQLQLLQAEARASVLKELQNYQNEVASARDKIWPSFVSALNKSLATGGVAAVAFNLVGGAGYVLAGSAVASGIAFLKGVLDIRAEINKARRSSSPAIAYLSRVQAFKS